MVGAGSVVIEPVQQPGDDLGVAAVREGRADMIEEAGAERARIGGLPGDRVDAGPGEPVPGRGVQGRGDPAGRHRCHRGPLPGLGQGGRD